MGKKAGELSITISGDAGQLARVLAGSEAMVKASAGRMAATGGGASGGSGGGIGSLFGAAKSLLPAVGASAAVAWMSTLGREAVQMSRDFEVAEAQLKTLTGSAASAKNLFGELRGFASKTPFELTAISSVTRKLMGSGIEQSKALEATKQIAAVAAGSGGDVNSLGRAYSQVVSNGRFMTEELNQFADADFPIKEFALTAKTSMAALREAMANGLVPVSVMEDTFKRLSAQGGKFGTALEDMAKTAEGRKRVRETDQKTYMAERGSRLEEMHASREQIGNAAERGLVDIQVFAAAAWHGLWGKGGWGGNIEKNLNPELTEDGRQKMLEDVARNKAERAAIAEQKKKEAEAKAEPWNKVFGEVSKLMRGRVSARTGRPDELTREDFGPTRYDVEPDNRQALRRLFSPSRGSSPIEAVSFLASLASGLSTTFAGNFKNWTDANINGGPLQELRNNQNAGRLNSNSSAVLIQEYRKNMAASFSLPTGAVRGSREDSAIIDNAVTKAFQPLMSVEDILQQMKLVEDRNNDELKDIRKQLQKLDLKAKKI